MPSSADSTSSSLRARVGVLSAMVGTVCSLLGLGVDPAGAVAIAAMATAVGVEISRRLTLPYPAPRIRVTVLVIILVVVVQLVGSGYPPLLILSVVLTAAWIATELAHRLTGSSYRWPRLTY
jgi:hypothetical protein